MTFLKVLLAVAVLVTFVGCSQKVTQVEPPPAAPGGSPVNNEPKKVTSVGVVKASTQPVTVSAGGAGQLIVSLQIQSGYHVNANPPTFSYLKATQLDITPADGISSSPISYPEPVNKTFAFADKPLSVYEGDTELKATIKADKAANKGEHKLAAVLRVQACDDQVCYPPGQIELSIPVTVK